MKILLVGSGGREHALALSLAKSPRCEKLYCAPGNPGIAEVAECVGIEVTDIDRLAAFAEDNRIDFVVAGPEAPLVLGLADRFEAMGIPVFGPSKSAARLEGSKGFTKDLCAKFDIPTAAYGRFSDHHKAADFIREKGAPIVIKADGLAGGKGVVIATTVEEALSAAHDMMSGDAFGEAGADVVIEEFLDGEELSFFALCDGETVVPFASAQDHKRVGDGDTGPNTGGMGAYSPAHLMTPDLQQKIMDRIILPTARGMAEIGAPFKGVFFAGIMVVTGEPYLIEYNVRFGDPECQVMLPRLKTDLVDILHAAATGNLSAYRDGFQWSQDYVLGVVLAANGYPGPYQKLTPIDGIDDADAMDGAKVFHAGTILGKNGEIRANGGRVLTVTASAKTIADAQARAYKAVDAIDWPEGFCRRDIGWRAVAAEKA